MMLNTWLESLAPHIAKGLITMPKEITKSGRIHVRGHFSIPLGLFVRHRQKQFRVLVCSLRYYGRVYDGMT